MAQKNNYDIMKETAGKLFLSYDREIVRKRCDREDDDCFYLKFFGTEYAVNKKNAGITETDSGEEADPNTAMVLYDILCYSKETAAPSGKFVPLQNLSRVLNASSYAGEGMYGKLEKKWDGQTEKLAEACEKLGGIPFGKGDVSCRFHAFLHLDLVFSFWKSDEDFPAQIQILCDTETLSYIHYETAWYMTCSLMDRIEEQMEKEKF